MCGTNSRWLGPKRRKAEHGSETGGTPRAVEGKAERSGFRQGACVNSKQAGRVRA
jgi:hypothetical protein